MTDAIGALDHVIIGALDHVIIAVEDLDVAEAAIHRLGFRTTPRGIHSAHKGTANVTSVLPDLTTYFEILAVMHPTDANAPVRADIEAGRQLSAIAMKTHDADAVHEAYAAAGISGGPVNAFSRPVETPAGEREASFRTTFVSREGALGLFVFACQHLTPELVWRDGYLEQPNAAVALAEVVGAASDFTALEAAWAKMAPDAPLERSETLRVSLGTTTVSFLSPDAYRARFDTLPPSDPGLGALVFACADLARTRAALSERGTAFVDNADTLTVPAAPPLGTTFVFRAA